MAARLKSFFEIRKAEKQIRSQAELGEKIGISQSAVGQYLNGEIPLNIEAQFKFASALDINVADLNPDILSTLLSNDEKSLISAYRNSTETGKEALLKVAELAPAYPPKS